MKTAKATLKGKIRFTVTGVNLKNIELRVSSADQEIVVKLSAEALLVLLDQLRFATESVISQLDGRHYLEGSPHGVCER